LIKKFNKGYFIIGTDTDIGKTYVSSVIFKSLLGNNIGYYKPFQTGCYKENNQLVPLDPKFLCDFTDIPLNNSMTTYLFETPVSPHLASELENIPININKVLEQTQHLFSKYDTTFIEAAGGIYVPIIRNKYFMFNLIQDLNLPVILVCSTKVGSINHTLLTFNFLKEKNIKIQGIIFNGYTNEFYENDNIKIILDISKIQNYIILNQNDTTIPKESLFSFLEN
jgi:dethiobiotin synthetase